MNDAYALGVIFYDNTSITCARMLDSKRERPSSPRATYDLLPDKSPERPSPTSPQHHSFVVTVAEFCFSKNVERLTFEHNRSYAPLVEAQRHHS